MILRLPRISQLLTASFLVNLAFSIFYIALPVYVVQELSWSPVQMALFFAFMSLVMVVIEGPILKRVSKFCSNSVLIMGGGLVLGFGFAMLDTQMDATVYSAAVLIAVGNGLLWPLLVAELSDKAGEQQGAVQGLAGSTGAIASIIGLLMGGILYSSLQGWLFLISAFLVFLVTLLALHARHSGRRSA
jgi:MFS family permease